MQEPDDNLDVIPGMDDDNSSATATATADVPFDRTPEQQAADIVIPDFTPDMTSEEVERSGYRQVPLGAQTLEVLKVEPQGEPKPIQSWLRSRDGKSARRKDYVSQTVRVTLCLPGDDLCTVSDFFQMPPVANTPEGRDQRDSWMHGFGREEWAIQGGQGGGREYRRLVQFLARLGFKQDEQKRFEPTAFRALHWLHYPNTKIRRRIGAEIIAGKPNDKGKVYHKVDTFKYFEAEMPPDAAVAASNAGPAPEKAPAPAAREPEPEAEPEASPAPEAAPVKKNGRKAAVAV